MLPVGWSRRYMDKKPWYPKFTIWCILKKTSTLRNPKTVVRRCTVKKVFLKISQNSQENTCAWIFFFNRLKTLTACNFIKKETLAQMLSCESCEIFKKTYFAEHLRTTAFESGAHLSSNFRKFFKGDKQISEYFESKL